jgi:hypothetical protein
MANSTVQFVRMESLVSDFIERGADISAGQQKGLTAYWRWILAERK